MQTINDVIARLPRPNIDELKAPPFSEEKNNRDDVRVGLAVQSMRNHTTDEGWQIFRGLHQNGWILSGYNLDTISEPKVDSIIRQYDPSIVLLQDKREWDLAPRDFREPRARFYNVTSLREKHDIFKLTILKDSQQRPFYHRDSAEEIGCHAWVIYYHPKIVKHLAPYIREEHLVRTYHTIDSDLIKGKPAYIKRHDRALLSGAISGSYPLRMRLMRERHILPFMDVLPHPGYHRNGCCTPSFLELLHSYKVAICTSSVFGYALRKIIEATACGCVVITDLPYDDVLPHIDGNLIHIDPSISSKKLANVIATAIEEYDEAKQRVYAAQCLMFYDYRVQTHRLNQQITEMRNNYNANTKS